MIGLRLDKSWFFDRPKVQRAVGDATRRVLSKFGAFVRTAARHSIRKRKAVSQPGNPPSSHTGLLRNRIYFAYDPARQSVVIGPTPINQVTFDRDIKPVSGIVPEILEYGGSAGVIEEAFRGDGGRLIWRRRDLRRYGKVALVGKLRANLAGGQAIRLPDGNFVVPTGHNRFRTYHVKARPYMGPAFEQEKKNLPALWADSVRAA
jgi:hypothetical protein